MSVETLATTSLSSNNLTLQSRHHKRSKSADTTDSSMASAADASEDTQAKSVRKKRQRKRKKSEALLGDDEVRFCRLQRFKTCETFVVILINLFKTLLYRDLIVEIQDGD